MKVLDVRKLDFKEPFPDLYEISARLDKSEPRFHAAEVNWKKFAYKPDVAFSLGYTDNEILIKYYIAENWFKAEKTETNQMVYEDSCVEFFVSPDDSGIYYNFEFNGIGTCLMGSGKDRYSDRKANTEVVSKIRRITSVGTKPVSEKEGKFSWTITIAIPFRVFFNHEITGLKGKTFRANFYKCGDKLTVPHYLTWNPVLTEKPDFHRPEYFGLLKFV
jgi:hypothetical protein